MDQIEVIVSYHSYFYSFQLCNGLEQGEPNLMLKKLNLPDGQYQDCVLYQQGNVTATRKKIIPMLKLLVCGN